MRKYGIEVVKGQVTIFGESGTCVDNRLGSELIEFLDIEDETIMYLLDTSISNADKCTNLSKSMQALPLLLLDIYDIGNTDIDNDLITKIFNDIKECKVRFKAAADYYLDEDAQHANRALNPIERYQESPIFEDVAVMCNISIDSATLEVKETYYPESVFEACYVFFIKMITNNILIKRCGNCGKYFVKRLGYNNRYCLRPIPGTNKTCKDVGANLNYEKDDIQKIFDRYYKKIGAYCKRKNLMNQLANWRTRALSLKDKVRSENIPIEEFQKMLVDIENEEVYGL